MGSRVLSGVLQSAHLGKVAPRRALRPRGAGRRVPVELGGGVRVARLGALVLESGPCGGLRRGRLGGVEAQRGLRAQQKPGAEEQRAGGLA
jgi:hypothetical protein